MTSTKSSAQRLLIVALELLLLAAILVAVVGSGDNSPKRAHAPLVHRAAPPRAVQRLLPDATRRTVAQARATLNGAGYPVQVSRAPSASVPAGLVASTSPPPFSLLSARTRVVLVVSTGPPRTVVPSVRGASLARARKELRHAGLSVTVGRSPSTSPANTVLSQAPTSGMRLRRGASVHLVVARPIPKVTVPRVTGEREKRAAGAISAQGLVLAFVKQPVGRSSKYGVVLAQSPRAGSKLARGGRVTLTVGKPKSHHHR